jgi:exodeoxyribonuclease VII small subunit
VTESGTEAAPKEALSYEQARDKLAAVVKRLEAGGLTLEQSLELWERGERLAAVCGNGWTARGPGSPPRWPSATTPTGPGRGRTRPSEPGSRVCLPFCWASAQ